jgi:hypothetical protein
MTIERRAPTPTEADMRAEIARARLQLVGTADALRRQFRETWDVRSWVRRRPGLTLCIAFGAGVWLGTRHP